MGHYAVEEETAAPEGIVALQHRKLTELLSAVRAANPFYQRKLAGITFDGQSNPVTSLPLTTRAEIQQDQLENPPYGTNLTYPRERYTRLHQTSGTAGEPLRWLDTAKSWDWWKHCWAVIFTAAAVTPADRFMFPFTFGPFIGFWGAFESATKLGCLCLPTGGMTTTSRLRFLLDHEATFICCTPTYALRMIEVASEDGIDLSSSAVRGLIVAGEPGGSIPATRRRIETAFGARVFDHAGMTEIGPWGFECAETPGGLHVMESEFIAEVIDPETTEPVPDGQIGELVLTNLGRVGSPLIRYSTGDQVCLIRKHCACGRWFARAEGGILGRNDDMFVIRGNNVFPAAIEGIVREFEGVTEFQVEVDRRGPMADLVISLEPAPGAETAGLVDIVSRAIRDRLHFKPRVTLVEPGSLPRYEMKAKRVVLRDRPTPC